jgi:hypothetical protein
MADNIDVTPGTGKTIAADEIASVLHQRVKIQHGADGSATDVSSASPLPVTIDSADVVSVDDNGGSLTVDGTVAATQSGTWNVATVTAVTGITNVVAVNDNSGSLTVDGTVAATQSGTWTVGVSATPSVTVKRAVISAASAGDNTLVAAVAAAKIKVLSLGLIASGDVDVRLESGAGGTALTGVISLAADGNGFVASPALPGYHHWETAVNTLLNLELSGAVQVSGWLVYYEEA